MVICASTKALVVEVLLESEPLRYFHCVNQRSVAAAPLASTTSPDDPVTYLCEFHNISPAAVAEFAVRKRAIATERIRRKAKIVLNNVREEVCHNHNSPLKALSRTEGRSASSSEAVSACRRFSASTSACTRPSRP